MQYTITITNKQGSSQKLAVPSSISMRALCALLNGSGDVGFRIRRTNRKIFREQMDMPLEALGLRTGDDIIMEEEGYDRYDGKQS